MKTLYNRYLVFGLVLYSIMMLFGMQVWQNTWETLIFNMYSFFSFLAILQLAIRGVFKWNETNLFGVLFIYSILSVTILNSMYYNHHGDFMSYNAMDEDTYNYFALMVQGKSLRETLAFFLQYFGSDDLGAMLYVSTLYRIIESTLFVNFVNIILGAWSAVFLFRIGQQLMDKKYAFMAALSYFSTSFIMTFESIGLKETVFVFIVILTFYHFLRYLQTKQFWSLLWVAFFGFLIMFFRPAVLAMIIVSFGMSIFLGRQSKNPLSKFLLVILFFGAFMYILPYLDRMLNFFSSFGKSVAIRSKDFQKVEASEQLGIYAAILSSLIGPLPNLIARIGKEQNNLYASGLLFKVFISIPFWLGTWHILRKKMSKYYPFVFMSLMGLGVLIYIMEAYELRYHLTYFPFLFLIAFSYLNFYDSQSIIGNKAIGNRLNIGYIIVFLLVLFWNSRLL